MATYSAGESQPWAITTSHWVTLLCKSKIVCGDHFTIYTYVESLHCMPESNKIFYANYISIIKKKNGMFFSPLPLHFNSKKEKKDGILVTLLSSYRGMMSYLFDKSKRTEKLCLSLPWQIYAFVQANGQLRWEG